MAQIVLEHPLFAVRVAQAIARRTIADREEAERIGLEIAAFAVKNWDLVVRRFGEGADDDIDVVARLARETVTRRAEMAAVALRFRPTV